MHKTVDIALGADVLAANARIAEENSRLLRSRGITSFDLMGSIGSGKTLLIERMIDILKKKGRRPAAIAGDVAGDDDYRRFRRHGIPAVNVNTGKECHLDAHLIDHALERLRLDEIDCLFIENVGNLVCPTDFPLGTDRRVVVVSVTEGDDMVRKHPVIFSLADVIVVNKIDLAKAIEVDPGVLVRDARRLRPRAPVLLTDAKSGRGVPDLMRAMGIW
ncbi:MAG: hydrogenase nickel incorporation protein HypB [Thermoplasmatota archaeon]